MFDRMPKSVRVNASTVNLQPGLQRDLEVPESHELSLQVINGSCELGGNLTGTASRESVAWLGPGRYTLGSTGECELLCFEAQSSASLTGCVVPWALVPNVSLKPGLAGRSIASKAFSVWRFDIDSDYFVEPMSHPEEQYSTVLEGEFVMEIEKTPTHMRRGTFLHVPSLAEHGGTFAHGPVILLEVFWPPRIGEQTMVLSLAADRIGGTFR
jgi:quercetin dioxygenase-like cupin family protein